MSFTAGRAAAYGFGPGDVARHGLTLYRSGRADCYGIEADGRMLPGRMGWARVLGLVCEAFVRAGAP